MAHTSAEMDEFDAAHAMDVLRQSQDRALHREGIPMFVTLVDERPVGAIPQPGATTAAATTGGGTERTAAILARAEQYRAVLAPTRREGDMGVMISVLAVTAYEDFDRSVTR